jgi:cytochrome c oxidase accessory protein FixG
MFDLTTHRFFIFDLVIYPQDILWLAMLLFIAAALLFFATGLIGRAWCGFFCFQTLWTDMFILIEHTLQGEKPARERLAKQPWNFEKLWRVGGSHLAMLLISFWTGFTFAAYFAFAPQFTHEFFTGHAADAGYITVLVLTLTTYFAGGVAREKICMFACPYARFQGVMYEADTLAVAYDTKRGEGIAGRASPRAGGAGSAERAEKGHGDCIDCGYCVQVCPTGIDIRNGLQYQCISCGLCIDACNNIMESVGLPKGLIRYDSERNLAKDVPVKAALGWKQPKSIAYALVLIAMTSVLIYKVETRSDLEVKVQQNRQPLYTKLHDGSIRNFYQIHIINKSDMDQIYTIKVQDIPADSLDMGALGALKIRSGKDLRINAKVTLEHELSEQTKKFHFVVTPSGHAGESEVLNANFSSDEVH